jgi:hypothetical protein
MYFQRQQRPLARSLDFRITVIGLSQMMNIRTGVDAASTTILEHTQMHLIIQVNPVGRALAYKWPNPGGAKM